MDSTDGNDANDRFSSFHHHNQNQFYEVTSDEITVILRTLEMPANEPSSEDAERLYLEILERRHATRLDIEDVFFCACRQLLAVDSEISVERWCEIFSIPTRKFAESPGQHEDQVPLTLGVEPADVAELLITLEDIGFSIDPRPLVSKMIPLLSEQQYVSEPEISILWYERERHRGYPIDLATADHLRMVPRRFTALHTWTGYTADIRWNEADQPFHLTVTAPDFLEIPPAHA